MNLPKIPQQTPTSKIPQEKWELMSEQEKQEVMDQVEALKNFSPEGKSQGEILNELFEIGLNNPEGEKVVQKFRAIVDGFINIGTTVLNLIIGLQLSGTFEQLSVPWYVVTIVSVISSQLGYRIAKAWMKSKKDDFANAQMGQKLGFQDFMVAFIAIPFANFLTVPMFLVMAWLF